MSKPIRVLQVIGIMNQGGAETMIMNLYRHIDRNKVQFDFVENENDGALFDEEIHLLGGRVFHCPRFSGKNYNKYRIWWKDFFNEHNDYSVVHGHIGSTAAIYLKEAKNQGITTIAHSHSTYIKGLKQYLYRILSYPTRNIADYFFMCSKQAGIDRYGQRAASDSNRAFLLPNAIDTESFRFGISARNEKRKEFGIKENEYVIGHVGRFVDVKNHSFLLNVFKKAVEDDSSAKLLLVGDGELRKSIEEKAIFLGINEKVVFAGNRSDVNKMLSAMDVLVFPSKYEGLPLTLVEAQCNGLSCVISDKVPEDSVLIKELIQIRSLNDSLSVWAETAVHRNCINRSICADKIKETKFNVEKSAKWLEDFYLEKAK